MQECALKQADLAEVLEVSLSRVKAMTSGRVKNLTREESQALIDKLGIRAAWLVTGEGSMFRKDETQDEFISRHQAIGRMHKLLDAMPMQDITRMRVAVLLTGDPERDGPLIAEALSTEARGIDFATGQPIDASKTTTSVLAQTISEGDRVLLDNFHAAPAQVQAGVKTALGAFAPGGGTKTKRAKAA